jgi:hypothetical protein
MNGELEWIQKELVVLIRVMSQDFVQKLLRKGTRGSAVVKALKPESRGLETRRGTRPWSLLSLYQKLVPEAELYFWGVKCGR